MMFINGHISFFKINKCGTYTFTKKGPISLTPSELFKIIKEWKEKTDFENTLPWSKNKNKLQLRLFDIAHSSHSDDYILTFIKSDQDSSSQQVGIIEGEKKVVTRSDDHNGKKVTWGKPCYYWVIPSKNIIASIKFEHSRCDSKLLQEWVSAVVKARLEIPGAAKRTTEHNYIQFLYTLEDSEQAEQESIEEPKASIKTNFLFDVNIKSIKTSNSQLQELAQEVTQIVTREKVELTIADSRPFLLKTLSKIPKILDRSSEKHKKLDRMVEFRIEANPSAEDIKEIIESCSIEISPNDREHTNVGFVTKTGKIKWSDEYRLTKDFRLDSNGHHILPSSLILEKLQLERAQIMPLLEDDKTVDATSITAIATGA